MRLISFQFKQQQQQQQQIEYKEPVNAAPLSYVPYPLYVGLLLESQQQIVNVTQAFEQDYFAEFLNQHYYYNNEKQQITPKITYLTMRDVLNWNNLKLLQKLIDENLFRVDFNQIVLMAPIYDAEKVICIGMNYVDHCLEQNYPVPEEPIVFSKFASSITAPQTPIFSELTEELDYEVELTIVIGKAGKHIPKSQALDHVVGITVAHDVSARDWQLKKNGKQWLLGKTMDGYSPIGPSIVTLDELPNSDPHNLGIRCYLNGELVQNSNTNQLVHKIPDLVSWVSKFCTLKPGDLILTGTPPGVGVFRKPPVFLKHGDVVTCEIDHVGSITNTVVQVKSSS